MTIKELRENKGWSVSQLAQLAGVSQQTIYRIEAGNAVSRVYVARVCNALNVDINKVDGLNLIRGQI